VTFLKVMFHSGDQQKQVRCRKIRENRIRRLGGSDDASSDIISQTQSSSSQESTSKMVESNSSSIAVDVQPSEPVTHVIASAVNLNVIDGLPESYRVLIEEVNLVKMMVENRAQLFVCIADAVEL